ncbi:MAG: Putative oxidoreductase [uncultured Thermomicrobiales bacterium]|uniref:Oxidoreductase n=1 Tax=uncultured Thermomicrobiales bacterium TaxID=1645740 RepID=A0A6J4UXI1_9BACT|nr:MAG: Putative oxidoreductase [uncultured Thermomicrobiales bacterium]
MAATRVKIGVSITPQHGTVAAMRQAWLRAETLGVDSLWTWDHFFPLTGDPAGTHFEGFSLLAAMAAATTRPTVGPLVACNAYRNPNLLAEMAHAIGRIAADRFVLGLGAGWFEKDYAEYGYPFKTTRERLQDLATNLPIIEARLAALRAGGGGGGPIPLLIGGVGEKVTLRLAARHAAVWNGWGEPSEAARLNAVLDDRCAEIGRDPAAIERSLNLSPDQIRPEILDAYAAAGFTHFIVEPSGPDWPLDDAETLLRWRDGR